MDLPWADLVARDGTALAVAAAHDLDAAVPAAPGWDARELLRHVGLVHARTTVILRTGTMERPSRANGLLADPPSEDLLGWYDATLAELVATLADLGDPDRPVYAFVPGHQRAGFWPRRMAHETAVHRVDAQQAAGRPVDPFDPAFAADGIDELLVVLAPARPAGLLPSDGHLVELAASDLARSWRVGLGPSGLSVTADEGPTEVTVRGPAEGLLLWLWGRRPLEDLEVKGERAAALALRSATTF